MKNFLHLIFASLLFIISCQNTKTEMSNKIIKVRVFNFVSNKYEVFSAQKKMIRTQNENYFIYDFDKKNDTLKFIDNQIYYKGQNLNKLDVKTINVNGNLISITKCFFKNKRDFRGDKYLFVNDKIGLIFIHNSYGNMYEYDIKENSFMHKNIALNKLNFKDGDFEIKYAKMNYLDYKEL
jgi:hypothetical protein